MGKHELQERYEAIGRKYHQVLVDLTGTDDDEYLAIEALIQGVFEDSTKSIQPDLEQFLIDLTGIDSPKLVMVALDKMAKERRCLPSDILERAMEPETSDLEINHIKQKVEEVKKLEDHDDNTTTYR